MDTQRNASWIWNFILGVRPMSKARSHGLPFCNGRIASFWFDNLSLLGILCDIFGSSDSRRLGFLLNSTLISLWQMFVAILVGSFPQLGQGIQMLLILGTS